MKSREVEARVPPESPGREVAWGLGKGSIN
jgi:hypothetical protein